MNEVRVTLVGTVATQPEVKLHNGVKLVSFRMVATQRRRDPQSGTWVDGDQTWATVTCWRALAANVEASVLWKDRVVVHGKLRTEEWTQDGVRRSTIAVTADCVGHDLTFGTSVFNRGTRRDDEALAARFAEVELARLVSDLPVPSLGELEGLEPPYDAAALGPAAAGPDDGDEPDDGHDDEEVPEPVGAARR